jgi:cell wall-associated NlpC family hydrolase
MHVSRPVVPPSSMPPRRRRLLPAFALVATVFGCAAALPLALPGAIAHELPGELESAAAATHRPTPARAPKFVVSKPTLGERAAAIALDAVGVPYHWGGASPASGFDCSGLVYWAYGRLGVELPHSSYALYGLGREVRHSTLKAGDLLFFSGLGHVGLYVGRGRMVHAPHSGRHVEVVRLGASNYGDRLVGARRLGPAQSRGQVARTGTYSRGQSL